MSHGGVVISLGRNTKLYSWLMENMPRCKELMVDVQDPLPAPPWAQRTPGVFPDPCVVDRIRAQKNFQYCVNLCKQKLRKYGIVLVYCKGGNHRAPTVAHELGQLFHHRGVGSFFLLTPHAADFPVTSRDAVLSMRCSQHEPFDDCAFAAHTLTRMTTGKSDSGELVRTLLLAKSSSSLHKRSARANAASSAREA